MTGSLFAEQRLPLSRPPLGPASASLTIDPRLPMHDNPDLASLHGDPEFEAIVEVLRRKNEEGDAQAVE